jgi:hypothetical protein
MKRCSPNPGNLLHIVEEFSSDGSIKSSSLQIKQWPVLYDMQVVHKKGEAVMLVSFEGFSILGDSIVKIVSANGITYCHYKTLEENCEIVK